MKHYIPRRTTAIVAALLCGTTASADVTAQQVWDMWKAQTELYGDGFSIGSEEMAGDTLTVSDIVITYEDMEASLRADLGTVTLTENGDGTVTVLMEEEYPVVFVATPRFGDPTTVNLIVRQEGMVLVASGTPEDMAFEITANSYGISVDSLEGQGADEVDIQEAAFSFTDIAGQYGIRDGDPQNIEYQLAFGSTDLGLQMTQVEGDGFVEVSASISDLKAFATLALPADMDLESPESAFADGLAFDGGYSFGSANYSFDFSDEFDEASGSMQVAGGQLAINGDIDGFGYIGKSTGIAVSLFIPSEFPFPIEASLAEYGFDIMLPLTQSDEPRDARFAFNLTELAVNDGIWNLFDPGMILPRDPATIALDLSAKVTPYFDFLDPDQQQAMMMADMPAALNSVALTDFVIAIAGAEITGEGAFDFDNNDLDSFDGFPRPEGAATFAINGVNGLVDKLVQMGLIPAEEVMMPRMMMGMFTTPVGDDMMSATIEVNSEGHVLANGQRLR